MRTILCYGDSNTYGCVPKRYDPESLVMPGNNRYNRDERWPGVLNNELCSDFFIIEEGLCGRTTVLDDPIAGKFVSGKRYLLTCLLTHAPIDLVIIMLGSNDLQRKYSFTAYDIASGIAVLIEITKKSASGPGGEKPKILIICPPPIGKTVYFPEILEGAYEKSTKLSIYYKLFSDRSGCYFLNAGEIIKSSDIDGLHFDKSGHLKLGRIVAKKVKGIFK